MHEFKGLAGSVSEARGLPIGESFEIAADDTDTEAREHPSVLPLGDGSEIGLPELLEAHAELLLGADFVARYGRTFPLLPKILDVAELLSVQGHPEGNTEVYVVIAADEGATIRLGFAVDVDAAALERQLTTGRAAQRRLLDLCRAGSARELQNALQPWLATRTGDVADVEQAVRPMLTKARAWSGAAETLAALHRLYWEVLDLMNAIPVAAGQVIFNANPARIVTAAGRAASAEVHALGNPEGRELLALEIRRPGPTFRAWDNVRFPLRDVDAASAIAALNLRRTRPEEFLVQTRPVPGRPGVSVSVDTEQFRLEHLQPTRIGAVSVPVEPPHCLHVIEGEVGVYATDGTCVGRLGRGSSAIVPLGVGAYRIATENESATLVKVGLPIDE